MLEKLSGRKVLVIAPIMAMLLAFLFSCAMYPMAHAGVKDIPVAVASLDEGLKTPAATVNMGDTMIKNIENVASQTNAMKLTVADGQDKALKGVKTGKYCAALIIPADFTTKQMSAATPKPSAPTFHIYINQGKFAMAATMAEQALTGMVDNAGNMMKPEILKAYEASGVTMSPEQAAYYDTPLAAEIEYVNPVNSTSGIAIMGANVLTAMITWMSTLIMSILVYLYYRKERVFDAKYSAVKITTQVFSGLINACILAIFIILIMKGFEGFDIGIGVSFVYVAIASFCVTMLLIGILRWTHIPGIALFMLAMFLCMPTASLPYEMLPDFWQDWIYPWSPVGHISNGLKEVFYISGDCFNDSTIALMIMGVVGLALQYLSLLYKEKVSKSRKEESDPQ